MLRQPIVATLLATPILASAMSCSLASAPRWIAPAGSARGNGPRAGHQAG